MIYINNEAVSLINNDTVINEVSVENLVDVSLEEVQSDEHI